MPPAAPFTEENFRGQPYLADLRLFFNSGRYQANGVAAFPLDRKGSRARIRDLDPRLAYQSIAIEQADLELIMT
ncbi:MAG: hypothetical protein M3N39_07735 [Pseudomonadota bacterium]|nr:hypothetical protein [Pseudomonadota bacterium]